LPFLEGVRFQLWRLRDRVRADLFGTRHSEAIFTQICEDDLWGGSESVSGVGSSFAATTVVRQELPHLLKRLQIRSLLDAPCGDFVWMKEIVGHVERYIGVDIVRSLIRKNLERFSVTGVTFVYADITKSPLPTADLVLCRDCFSHLPTRMIHSTLRNFRRTGARHLLLTNNADVRTYHDIPIGSFRPINFRLAPFLFPEPLFIIWEARESGRQLCLWEMDALLTK